MAKQHLDIFDAARASDVKTVRAHIEKGCDLKAKNEYGFTALHCAAMGANNADFDPEVIKILLKAGSPLDETSKDGRTALFLASEFAIEVDAVKILLDAGADPKASTGPGNILLNALSRKVQEFLAKAMGVPVPKKEKPLQKRRLSLTEWKEVKGRLDFVFAQLKELGLIAEQAVGNDQDDAFSICGHIFNEEGKKSKGFCFYSKQDQTRAKSFGQLALGFGAASGEAADSIKIGKMIITILKKENFEVVWNETIEQRPVVIL